jgi:hypothetical protein
MPNSPDLPGWLRRTTAPDRAVHSGRRPFPGAGLTVAIQRFQSGVINDYITCLQGASAAPATVLAMACYLIDRTLGPAAEAAFWSVRDAFEISRAATRCRAPRLGLAPPLAAAEHRRERGTRSEYENRRRKA